MLDFESIKSYWNARASEDNSAQSTTQDVFLREIELRSLADKIALISPKTVADIGCGDGRTTMGIANMFKKIKFTGFDYSSSMIENAKKLLASTNLSNITFNQLDVCDGISNSFDLIYTTRCLINLPSWDLQKNAIRNIHKALNANGAYIMIENFIEGQDNFNKVRSKYGLSKISVRDHNCFFSRKALHEFTKDLFYVDEEVNISSTYYLVSRVIYSKMCVDNGVQPDYFDVHHRYAADLPFCGEYGPVRLVVLRKK